jgi:flotillin
MPPTNLLIAGAMILIFLFFIVPALVAMFLRDVAAGSIRIVTWWGGKTHIYRGPGKSYEIPLLTNGTTLSSKAINVDLDITDQTADIDEHGVPQPIKVRVLASAIVSVGDTDQLIRTAANRFFAKPEDEQMNTITDLLSSSGRRAVNLLTHDQLFSAKTAPRPGTAIALPAPAALAVATDDAPALVDRDAAIQVAEDDDDPLAIIIRKACSRELTDLGLIFNSLNIKVVQSEVAEARRRMSAAEAAANADIVAAQQARRSQEAKLAAERSISDSQRELEQTRASNAGLIAEAEIRKQQAQQIAETKRREAVAEANAGADIISAQQARRAKEAQLEAERTISDRQRELEQTMLANAVLIAEAEARKQDALAGQRESELRATQTAQATADAQRVQIEAQAAADAAAIRITTIAQANAESIRKINEAIREGGENYLRYRQMEMLPEIVPSIANALAKAKLVTICSGHESEGAAGAATDNITGVIRTVLAAQLVSRNDLIGQNGDRQDGTK